MLSTFFLISIVIGAHGLIDLKDGSDPYCKLTVGNQEHKTQTKKKVNESSFLLFLFSFKDR